MKKYIRAIVPCSRMDHDHYDRVRQGDTVEFKGEWHRVVAVRGYSTLDEGTVVQLMPIRQAIPLKEEQQ